MTGIDTLVPKLKANALAGEITVLTPAEARAIHEQISNLEYRLECAEEKVLLTMQNSYDMVQTVVKLRRQLDELSGASQR